jgi:hypothetical protein
VWNNRRRANFIAGLVNVSRVVSTQPGVGFGEQVLVPVEIWGTAAEN